MSTNKDLRVKIRNVSDLMNEIARVNVLKEEQEAYLGTQYQLLKKKIETPARVGKMLLSNVPGAGLVKGLTAAISSGSKKSNGKTDWLTKALQVATPLVLNRTFLKNAGWLKKALVMFASERAVSSVNQSSVSNVVSGIANFIRPKNKRKKEIVPDITAEEAVESNQYGIPKDSETY